MRSGTIALLTGMVLLYQLSAIPSAAWIVLIPLSGYLWWRFNRPVWKLATIAILGGAWAGLHAHAILEDRLPESLEGQDLVVEGVIDSIPRNKPHAWRFVLQVQRIEQGTRLYHQPRRIRLNWYAAGQRELKAGDRWRLVVRLKRPRGFYNPGGFDYEKYLFAQRIGATGYVRHGALARRLPRHWHDAPVQRLRQQLRDRLAGYFEDTPWAGIVAALAVGERSGISDAQWSVFRDTGTAHLIAISGLHIGLLAALAFGGFNLLWRVHPRLMLWQPAPRVAAVAAMVFALAYAALAGFSLPTQRALLMVATVLLALIMQRRVRPSHTLALTLTAVLFYDPTSVLSAGFWLSFGAVAIILYLFAGIGPRGSRWWQWGRLQWGISIGLAPLLLLFFNKASVVAPLANLVAVPVVSFAVVPLTLLLVGLSALGPWAAKPVAMALDAILGWLWQGLEWLQAAPGATWSIPAPSLMALIMALAGIGVLFLPRGVPHRYLGVVLCVPLLFPRVSAPADGNVWVSVLDVGQGLAAVVQTARHVLVFDAGPRFSSGFNTGEAVVLPLLAERGIEQVDRLIISHADIDHRGGVIPIVEALAVKQVLSSFETNLPAAPTAPCLAGEQWRWDGVDFELLHPSHRWRQRTSSENNASCVLRVHGAGRTILFTADIETPAEKHLLERRAAQLRADILVVPHHGSKTSSSDAFIDAVDPNYAIVPAGYGNRYGFPHDVVRQRFSRRGIPVLRTGDEGAIEFRLGPGQALTPHRYRRDAGHLWHE